MARKRPVGQGEPAPARFPPELLYRAARLYYLEDATQAEVASALGTSRPTVSRLLAQARATGIVTIDVREPGQDDPGDLAARLVQELGLRQAHVAPSATGLPLGSVLAPGVSAALRDAALEPGDALLVSSGASVHAVAQQPLPAQPGVLLAPLVGGVNEPEEYYQTNELARSLAVRLHATPVMLYAPAMPSAALRKVLLQDEHIQRVTGLWRTAKAALIGVGAPTGGRSSLPSVLPQNLTTLNAAIGDICTRPFDAQGRPIPFPGSERLMAMELADLRRIPHVIACAIGAAKVPAIRVAARAGYLNTLVTDSSTAHLLLGGAPGAHGDQGGAHGDPGDHGDQELPA